MPQAGAAHRGGGIDGVPEPQGGKCVQQAKIEVDPESRTGS